MASRRGITVLPFNPDPKPNLGSLFSSARDEYKRQRGEEEDTIAQALSLIEQRVRAAGGTDVEVQREWSNFAADKEPVKRFLSEKAQGAMMYQTDPTAAQMQGAEVNAALRDAGGLNGPQPPQVGGMSGQPSPQPMPQPERIGAGASLDRGAFSGPSGGGGELQQADALVQSVGMPQVGGPIQQGLDQAMRMVALYTLAGNPDIAKQILSEHVMNMMTQAQMPPQAQQAIVATATKIMQTADEAAKSELDWRKQMSGEYQFEEGAPQREANVALTRSQTAENYANAQNKAAGGGSGGGSTKPTGERVQRAEGAIAGVDEFMNVIGRATETSWQKNPQTGEFEVVGDGLWATALRKIEEGGALPWALDKVRAIMQLRDIPAGLSIQIGRGMGDVGNFAQQEQKVYKILLNPGVVLTLIDPELAYMYADTLKSMLRNVAGIEDPEARGRELARMTQENRALFNEIEAQMGKQGLSNVGELPERYITQEEANLLKTQGGLSDAGLTEFLRKKNIVVVGPNGRAL